MLTQQLGSDGRRLWAQWCTLCGGGGLLEKQYQRYRTTGKERMLTIFLIVMSIMTIAMVPFFDLEDPVQVFRVGSCLLIWVYTCLLRILFSYFPTMTLYWDYFVFIGATHMIVSYSLSYDRVAKLLGQRYVDGSWDYEINSQVSIAAVLLGVGLLLKVRWQCFASLAVLAPTCYFVMGSIFECLGCENGAPNLEMGAVHLSGLGVMILLGVVLHERDRRRLWDSCCDAAHLMTELKVAHSLRERLLRSVFDVSFAAQITQSGDLQVVGEWPAFDNFIGTPMTGCTLTSQMPNSDKDRFLHYVRQAVNNTDEAIPACLFSVNFEPETGCSLAANMYIVSASQESVITVCLSTKGAEGNEFGGCEGDLPAFKKGAAAAASALADRIKNYIPAEPQAKNQNQSPHLPLPSLHSAPTIVNITPETRLLTACEDDCLLPDSVAWVEGQPMPQPLSTLISGQKVLCHDNVSKGLKYAEILDVKTESGTAKWVSVVLEDGTSLQMTANHPVQPLTGSHSGAMGAVRAMDLCPGSDYLMVLKTMPVLVQEVEAGEAESEDRVFLTLRQPQRHSLFVASPPRGGGAGVPTVQTMAVGSADVVPTRSTHAITVKNGFIDLPERDAMPVLKRSNSAPPDVLETKWLPSISSAMSSSLDDSSVARFSEEDVELILAPSTRPAWRGGVGLGLEPRYVADAVALSEVLSIQGASLRSFGSFAHAQGNCKSCLFSNRVEHNGGIACSKGVFCERCHESHDAMQRRKPKTGRQRERSKIQMRKILL